LIIRLFGSRHSNPQVFSQDCQPLSDFGFFPIKHGQPALQNPNLTLYVMLTSDCLCLSWL
jgi:hypothetical protein